ncbi:hypothetical protein GCM10027422_23010 [Hymenobacter arcticus]
MIVKYSFEEFKLVYESTEKVIDRRLTNNKQNYTISVAILVGIAVVWKWSIENSRYFFGGMLLVLILAVFAVLFCSLWVEQIKDFKRLNDAKFSVINEMAKQVYFESNNENVEIKSYDPFTKEWEKLNAIHAIEENSTIKLITLNSSSREFFIPQSFRIIFALIVVVSLIISGNSFPSFISSL